MGAFMTSARKLHCKEDADCRLHTANKK